MGYSSSSADCIGKTRAIDRLSSHAKLGLEFRVVAESSHIATFVYNRRHLHRLILVTMTTTTKTELLLNSVCLLSPAAKLVTMLSECFHHHHHHHNRWVNLLNKWKPHTLETSAWTHRVCSICRDCCHSSSRQVDFRTVVAVSFSLCRRLICLHVWGSEQGVEWKGTRTRTSAPITRKLRSFALRHASQWYEYCQPDICVHEN